MILEDLFTKQTERGPDFTDFPIVTLSLQTFASFSTFNIFDQTELFFQKNKTS